MSSLCETLFRDPTKQIDFHRGSKATRTLICSFTEKGFRDITENGFAVKYGLARGFDVLSFKNICDDWYATLRADTVESVMRVACSRSDYTHKVAYGSSMGAYAALKFSRSLSASAVLAISPQFDISCDWDTRWRMHCGGILPFRSFTRQDVNRNCHYFIAYDPFDLDSLHFQRYSAFIPRSQLTSLRVNNLGHPVGPALNRSGELGRIIECIVAREQETSVEDVTFRLKADPEYYFGLARRLYVKKRTHQARTAIERALKKDPLHPEYNIFSAQIYEMLNEYERAVSAASIAVTMRPDHPYMRSILANLLGSGGHRDACIHHIDHAIELQPDEPHFRFIKDKYTFSIGVVSNNVNRF